MGALVRYLLQRDPSREGRVAFGLIQHDRCASPQRIDPAQEDVFSSDAAKGSYGRQGQSPRVEIDSKAPPGVEQLKEHHVQRLDPVQPVPRGHCGCHLRPQAAEVTEEGAQGLAGVLDAAGNQSQRNNVAVSQHHPQTASSTGREIISLRRGHHRAW